MPNRTADVVVVGAGIIGVSIAYQLARHGAGRIVLLDKGAGPGEGSTGASSSISRCRYTHQETIRLAHQSQRAYGEWAEFTGLAEPRASLHRVGLVWMLDGLAESARADAARLSEQDVEVDILDPAGLADLYPMLSACSQPFDLTGEVEHVCSPGEAFLHETRAGYVDPVGANQDLVEAASALGVEVGFGSRVVDVLHQGEAVGGVELADGSKVTAGLVVNAAGPWCNGLSALAGWEHRWTLSPTRIQTVYRSMPPEMAGLPIVADGSTGIYLRPEAGGQQVLIGSIRPEDEEEEVNDPDDFKRSPDAAYTELMLASLHHRIPELEARGQISGIAGLYTINREDVHPVVGPTGIDGFWVANGFSGHGFKLAPGIGSMIARAVTGTSVDYDTDVPMEFLGADREPITMGVKHVLA